MTIKEITMPQLGESVTEGTIDIWLVKEGDYVKKYDPIAEITTDKVNAEVPSSFSGTIKEIVAKEGETIAVDDLMCYIETDEVVSDNQTKVEEKSLEKTSEAKKDESMKKRYSPAVLKLAQEHQIDLNVVDGTGLGGRITRKDIEKIIKTNEQVTTENKKTEKLRLQTEEIKMSPTQPIRAAKGDREIPISTVRHAIAKKMTLSKQEIPHAWMTVEADVTDLVILRNNVKNEFLQNEGFNLTYFAFFVKVVAGALKEFPLLNSTWAGDKIIERSDINLNIAVASENELFVPVIKHADEKSIKGIAREIYELAEKARTGKLLPSDMQGGTFTINNTGTFGSVSSMGVINHPQAAILQIESIVKRPVIINDMFAARDMVNLSLSLDHRVLDGLVCGRFLQYVKAKLEKVNIETTSIY